VSDILSIPVLADFANPFDQTVWEGLDVPIMRSEVEVMLDYPLHPDQGPCKTRPDHARRIAWFVVNGWTDPIEVDVGVPHLNCWVRWMITDGNHRTAAAIYRGDPTIEGSFGGSIDYGYDIGLIVQLEADVA
jgi:hypothetical protein